MNLNTWIDARVISCAHSPVVRFWSSWPSHHIVAQAWVVRVSHVIHACSERYSSTLSSPFHPTSSTSHSSSISGNPSCISSTTLRAVVTLRTSPKRRWTLLTNPTSTHSDDQCLRPSPTFDCRTACLERLWTAGRRRPRPKIVERMCGPDELRHLLPLVRYEAGASVHVSTQCASLCRPCRVSTLKKKTHRHPPGWAVRGLDHETGGESDAGEWQPCSAWSSKLGCDGDTFHPVHFLGGKTAPVHVDMFAEWGVRQWRARDGALVSFGLVPASTHNETLSRSEQICESLLSPSCVRAPPWQDERTFTVKEHDQAKLEINRWSFFPESVSGDFPMCCYKRDSLLPPTRPQRNFVKGEATQTTQSNNPTNKNTRLAVAKKGLRMGQERRTIREARYRRTQLCVTQRRQITYTSLHQRRHPTTATSPAATRNWFTADKKAGWKRGLPEVFDLWCCKFLDTWKTGDQDRWLFGSLPACNISIPNFLRRLQLCFYN